ncbi:MAG: FKBP-type peptidyl-prolyl cis-trans isomerase [Rikenellaceae bacterium]
MKKVLCAAAIAALLATSCGGEQTTISEGNSSKLDSLSYALGANIAFSLQQQLGDVPFDYAAVNKALTEAALEKTDLTQEQATEVLRDYFMNKRPARAEAIAVERDKADSTALANGADTAAVFAARMAMKADAAMFESEAEREDVSIAFGIDLGTNLRNADLPLQTYWVTSSLSDVNDGNPKMSSDAAMAYLQEYFTVTLPAERAETSVANLAKIEKQSGVVKTESGLLYRIEEAGEQGTNATSDEDTVKVNYTGKLLRNGEVFDSSRFADKSAEEQAYIVAQGGEAADSPIEFPLNRVIPGWTEGMKLVGKGGRISLWIPAELAYGSRGAGQNIGPNEALFFDVELVDVTPAGEAQAE